MACTAAPGLVACGSPEPRRANPTRPLDERRAVQVIIDTFREYREQPLPGREVELAPGKSIKLDVQSEGHKYGVAYLTHQERHDLGAALPPRDPGMGDALQLVRGTAEEEAARILVLYDIDYLYDDHVGADREETTITAEQKLSRDVRDFLVRAQAEQWP